MLDPNLLIYLAVPLVNAVSEAASRTVPSPSPRTPTGQALLGSGERARGPAPISARRGFDTPVRRSFPEHFIRVENYHCFVQLIGRAAVP